MEISVAKVKQYNSTYKFVLVVNGNPVCATRSPKTMGDCVAYLMNRTPLLSDGKIMKILDKVRKESEEQNESN